MAVYTTNLILYTGTDFEQSFILANEDDEDLLNLSQYTGFCKMKKHGTSSSHTPFAVSFTNPTGGTVKVSMGSTLTSTLSPGRYYYDLVLNKNGENVRVVEGEVFVKKSITR